MIGPALVGVAFLVVIVMRPSKPVERLPIDKKEIALEPLRPIPAPPPIDFGQVRAPVATDLATYTDQLARHGTLKATIYTRIGTIHCELFADKTPITVANFVGLATGKKPWTNPATHAIERGKRFYDGLTFHRAISGFMIQGGDPLGTGIGGPGYQFEDEVVPELKMQPGALAMANAGPGTNGSQFFITESAPSYLDGRHTIFGRCVDLDVVSKIAHADQNEQNKPTEDITMAITITR